MSDKDLGIVPDLGGSKEGLHEIFASIFPNQSDGGHRLRGLLYIQERGSVNRKDNQEKLIEVFGVDRRQSLYNARDTLIEAGLLEVDDYEWKLTEEGAKLLNSMSVMTQHYSGNVRADSNESSPDIPCYDFVYITIYTNGEDHATYYHMYEIGNEGSNPIDSVTHTAGSRGSNLDSLDLNYSENIKDWSIIEAEPDWKKFELSFDNSIRPSHSDYYWFSYNWPNNFHPEWRPWTYDYKTREYPIRSFLVNIINTKRVDEDSMESNVEVSSPTAYWGRFRKSRVHLVSTKDFDYLTFKAYNLPPETTINIKWDLKQ